VRQLARELAVNVNTVLRVYERLAADGLIDLRHGDGTYVTRRAKAGVSAQLTQRRRELAQEFDALVRRGLMLGVGPEDLAQMVAESIERASDPAAAERPIKGTESGKRRPGKTEAPHS